MNNHIELLTEKQAAKRLSISPRTLQGWRRQGGGPRFVRISCNCVRYDVADLQAWADSNKINSTSEYDDVANS